MLYHADRGTLIARKDFFNITQVLRARMYEITMVFQDVLA